MGVDKGILSAISDHKEKVKKPHFLFSAQNPKYPEKNSLGLNHEQVLHHLKGAGYDAHEVHGHYGAPEKSIVVYDVNPQHADKLHSLASKLGQDSSIHSTGTHHEMKFHHGSDAGQSHYGEGTNWHQQKPKDFFTSLPGDLHHFTHNFDFSQKQPSGKLKVQKSEEMKKSENDHVKLIHYSSKEGLKTIDPKHKGSGVDSSTKGRDTEHPHSFYYREGTAPEDLVVGRSAHKYKTSINTKERPLYDIGKDPHGIADKVRKENQGAFNMDMMHQKIKDAGFHGFHNSAHHNLSNVVVMYHPLKVEHHEPVR